MIEKPSEAIMQKYNSDTISNILTGLHFQQAPQDADMPYAVFYIIGVSQDEIMGDKYDNITNLSVQFNIFCESCDGGAFIALLIERLADCFDWAELVVRGYNPIKMQRESMGPILLQDEKIWQGTLNYEMSIQKQ